VNKIAGRIGWCGWDVRLEGQSREISLIKCGILANDLLFGDRIVEDPGFVFSRITNEDAFDGVRLQALPLILLDMHISSASKDTQIGDIRDFAKHASLGDRTNEGRGRGPVVDISVCHGCISPEGCRKIRLL
jgi:hypothetical protein